MNDIEYARIIYCKIFDVDDDGGDAYICGILDEIATLSKREQSAMECYYRHKKTLAQTGKAIGELSRQSLSNIINNVLSKLQQPLRMRNMSIAAVLEHKDKQIADAKARIAILYDIIDNLHQGKPVYIERQSETFAQETAISKIGFTTRVHNLLQNAGFQTVEALLSLDTLDVLDRKRNFGVKAREEIITKMMYHGYSEWAERMDKQN